MMKLRQAAVVGLLATSMLCRSAPDATVDPDERRQPMAGFQGQRLMGFAPDSYNADARTVDAVLATATQVKRYYFTEELEISGDAIDLSRATTGMVPLLDSHNQRETAAVLGTVSNVRIENGQLVGTLTFGETDRAKAVEGMVARGELKGISIGYRVNTWTIIQTEGDVETWRATRWELLEVSLVSVPADANAGVRAAGGPSPGATVEEDPMKRNNPGGAPAATPTPAANPAAVRAAEPQAPAAPAAPAPTAPEPVRAAEPAPAPSPAPAPAPAPAIARFSGAEAVAFVSLGRDLGVEQRANELVQQNEAGQVGTAAAREALLQAAGERQRTETAPARASAITVTRDGDETTRGLIVDAIVARASGHAPAEGSRQFMGMSLMDIARSRAGVATSERDAQIILRAANTSSDFPLLLEAAANKLLLMRYQAAAPTYRAIAKQRNLTDFKATKLLRVGDFPTLLAYQEDGEIKAGTINEGRETVILGSFGRILRLSRQAIVNDDLGAFDDVLGSIGGMVSRFENASFYAMKSVNSGNGPKLADNVNLFNASHGNLAAAGGAVDVTTLGAGRAAMRKQQDLDGNALNIAPAVILNGPDTETAIEQFLAPIVAADNTKVNPFSSKLTQVTEASVTGNAWELYADPNVLPVFHYGYLESAPGPRVMTHEPFNTDGLAFRVTLDFYSGVTDYRGAYRNPGA